MFKSQGRFDDAVYVQFTLEYERFIRFGKKADFKNLLKFIEIGEDNFSNVLDDDDPRIIEQDKEMARLINKDLYTTS